jgi:hypothetical protein|tara:strand:- start:127 stop:669 length:543 start_codon:yes stop_codon:yes gene_type:complete
VIILERILDPDIRVFVQVWHTLYKKFDGIPPRTAIDPLDLGRALAKVWLYEKLPDGSYVSAISGDHIRTNWGVRMKGKPLSEIIPLGGHKHVEKRFNYLLEKQCIIHGFNVTETKDHSFAERLYAPLTNADGEVIYVFGISNYNQTYYTDLDRFQNAVQRFEVYSYDPATLEEQEKLFYE